MKLSEIEAKVGLPFRAMHALWGEQTTPVTFEAKLSNGKFAGFCDDAQGHTGIWDNDGDWRLVEDPKPKRKALAYVSRVDGRLHWFTIGPIETAFERAPGFDIVEGDV